MLPSDITKMAQSFSDIAEGKDKDDSYLETDMKKRRKNNEKAVEDMKKVKDDTVPRWMREKFELVVAESYYYKRLKVMNVELAERFLDIAEGCIVMGYESPRLIDNIAEALDKDIVGHDFRAALGTVNPHLNENAQSAGRKQARAVAIQISEAPQKPGVYGKVGGLEIGTNPGKNQDLGYRAGRALTNMTGDLFKGAANQVRNIFTGTPNTAATNPAAARNNQRLKSIGDFVTTGNLPGSGASTPAAPAASTPAAAPAKPQRGQGGRDLGSTTQRQGGAVNPTTANAPAPAAPKPAPTAPAKPAPTAATKPFVAQTGNKAADMSAWAKANPKLAAAQKIRQSGGSRSEVNKALYNKGTAAATGTPTVVKAGYEHVHSRLLETLDEEKKKLPYLKMFRKAGNLGRDGSPEAMERSKKITKVMNDDAKRRADHRDRDDAAKEAKRMNKEEVEQIDEMPYQVYGSTDGKEEKKVGKPVKSRKYADARAAELEDTHKKTGGKYRSEYTKEEVTSLYDIVVGYLLDENLAIDEDHAVLVLPELTPEEVAYIVDEYTTKHGKKAMDWNRSDDKPKTVAKNPKMPKKKEGKCSCCGNDPCTC
jgi:hypothetical protein